MELGILHVTFCKESKLSKECSKNHLNGKTNAKAQRSCKVVGKIGYFNDTREMQ